MSSLKPMAEFEQHVSSFNVDKYPSPFHMLITYLKFSLYSFDFLHYPLKYYYLEIKKNPYIIVVHKDPIRTQMSLIS